MMNQFITYKLAKSMQKIGFKGNHLATIDQTEYVHIRGTKPISSARGSMVYDTVPCPTYQQCFDYFREHYKLTSHIDIYRYDEKGTKFFYQIQNFQDGFYTGGYIRYVGSTSIEQAREECLTKLISYL